MKNLLPIPAVPRYHASVKAFFAFDWETLALFNILNGTDICCIGKLFGYAITENHKFYSINTKNDITPLSEP